MTKIQLKGALCQNCMFRERTLLITLDAEECRHATDKHLQKFIKEKSPLEFDK